MTAPPKDTSQYPYEVSDEARQLTDTDMAFIVQYTGRPVDALRDHVVRVWQTAKQQVFCAYAPSACTVLTWF